MFGGFSRFNANPASAQAGFIHFIVSAAVLSTAVFKVFEFQCGMGDAHGGKSGLQGFFYGLEAGHVLYDHVCCEGVLGGADSPYVYVMDVAYTVFGGHCGLDLSGIDTLWGPVKHQT